MWQDRSANGPRPFVYYSRWCNNTLPYFTETHTHRKRRQVGTHVLHTHSHFCSLDKIQPLQTHININTARIYPATHWLHHGVYYREFVLWHPTAIVISSPKRPDRFWCPPSFLFEWTEGSFRRGAASDEWRWPNSHLHSRPKLRIRGVLFTLHQIYSRDTTLLNQSLGLLQLLM